MKKKLLITAVAACALLAGCTPKMTTVRPAEISELTVTRLADGASVTLPSEQFDADLKDTLIFQLEEPYDKAGACSADDAHTYQVQMYIGDKLDTDVIINADGSVCRNNDRYVPSDAADSPINIADWDALFADVSSDISSPVAPEPMVSEGFIEFKSQGAPAPFTEEIDEVSSMTCADVLPWSYYLSFAEANSKFVVWRDNPKGDAELLLSVTQPEGAAGLLNSIQYEGGAAESGGRYLYFSISEAATFHRSLWVFDTETLYFNQMYDAPCSNLVIPVDSATHTDPPSDFEDMGFIVYDHYLIPIELEKAEEYTGGIIDLNEYYEPLGEGLFYGIGDFGTHKFVRLLDLGDTVLEIESIVAEPETSAPEQRSVHQIDYSTMTFN